MASATDLSANTSEQKVTQAALARGDRVFATLRSPSLLADLQTKYPASQLRVHELDVTHEGKIGPAFVQAVAAFGRIDAVFNNAGFGVISEAEGIDDANARSLFEVMFWGASYVTREAVRTFREQVPPGGKLFQVASRTSIEAAPGVAHYSAAKAALEYLTEAYLQEVDKSWNIWFTLLEPALFRTAAPSRNIIEPQHPAYKNPSLAITKSRNVLQDLSKFDGNPAKLARVVLELSDITDEKAWPFRVPLHRVALEAARRKGRHLLEAAETQAFRSDDVYFGKGGTSLL
ncbi:NAD(P)-binding protein [Coniophora puteana RWD-64-598 SS2]|uniref:NAD(P)-binding protein n=1 Tax=Coniophora puteana (strain RWD-64-598) TaxID=741705 RepID=A0A5M3MIK3_CONPW|nr:NAD(P)-binding protein [Coniophora puteana RWD-64-598 SS2]EIW78933.1 NAD(P)-binding protein [Coniophora puteana RWD-64-598 SS2]